MKTLLQTANEIRAQNLNAIHFSGINTKDIDFQFDWKMRCHKKQHFCSLPGKMQYVIKDNQISNELYQDQEVDELEQ